MKELFYSNGVDIFGPVDIEEFSKNRYYKSTLIWYEGLSGWMNIADCDELKHLIGTLSTPSIETGLQQSLPNLTPPLSEQVKLNKNTNSTRALTALVLGIVLVVLFVFYLRQKSSENGLTGMNANAVISNADANDAATLKQEELANQLKSETMMTTYRKNWEKFITVMPNDYSRKQLGGIKDLKVIVKNGSPYLIDSMKIKLSYLKANGDTYQTEILRFDRVDSKSKKELFAPNSDRGVKVDCAIISIYSSAMNLCCDKTTKHFKSLTGEDPYRCLLQ